jgi:hypothetical protein
MNTVYFDNLLNDDDRREKLYSGQLFVYSASKATTALCEFARELTEEAFAPYHPCDAQHDLPVEKYVAILAELKPKFIHHPRCKTLIPDLLAEFGCDLDQTYFDVPRLRTACSGDYLRSGLAYAFKPHRDTWYSPPMCQLNWWLPIYPFESDAGMVFHPQYWDRPIQNSSHEFNYQDWNENGRRQAMQHVQKDTRRQSEALEEIEVDPQLRLVTPPGGLIIFSAAQLHSTADNSTGQTRLSVDFRTVHLGDLAIRHGAPNIDSHCTGTTIGDYLRGSDLSHVPDSVANMYRDASTANV